MLMQLAQRNTPHTSSPSTPLLLFECGPSCTELWFICSINTGGGSLVHDYRLLLQVDGPVYVGVHQVLRGSPSQLAPAALWPQLLTATSTMAALNKAYLWPPTLGRWSRTSDQLKMSYSGYLTGFFFLLFSLNCFFPHIRETVNLLCSFWFSIWAHCLPLSITEACLRLLIGPERFYYYVFLNISPNKGCPHIDPGNNCN